MLGDESEKIVSQTSVQTAMAAQMQAAHEAKRRRSAERAALSETIAPGVRVYPDSPPGVGWVLERHGKPPKYLATRELAIAHFDKIGMA